MCYHLCTCTEKRCVYVHIVVYVLKKDVCMYTLCVFMRERDRQREKDRVDSYNYI